MDVRATGINDAMKLAAVRAIASLAEENVPDEVSEAYGEGALTFGRDLIIPKPVDPRLISAVAPAVAKAAMDSGIAQAPITDWDHYKRHLEMRLGNDSTFSRNIATRAARAPKRVVFAEAEHYKVLKAAEMAMDEGMPTPFCLDARAASRPSLKKTTSNSKAPPSLTRAGRTRKSVAKRLGKSFLSIESVMV